MNPNSYPNSQGNTYWDNYYNNSEYNGPQNYYGNNYMEPYPTQNEYNPYNTGYQNQLGPSNGYGSQYQPNDWYNSYQPNPPYESVPQYSSPQGYTGPPIENCQTDPNGWGNPYQSFSNPSMIQYNTQSQYEYASDKKLTELEITMKVLADQITLYSKLMGVELLPCDDHNVPAPQINYDVELANDKKLTELETKVQVLAQQISLMLEQETSPSANVTSPQVENDRELNDNEDFKVKIGDNITVEDKIKELETEIHKDEIEPLSQTSIEPNPEFDFFEFNTELIELKDDIIDSKIESFEFKLVIQDPIEDSITHPEFKFFDLNSELMPINDEIKETQFEPYLESFIFEDSFTESVEPRVNFNEHFQQPLVLNDFHDTNYNGESYFLPIQPPHFAEYPNYNFVKAVNERVGWAKYALKSLNPHVIPFRVHERESMPRVKIRGS